MSIFSEKLFSHDQYRIKNLPKRRIPIDFRFSTFSFLSMLFLSGGFISLIFVFDGPIPATDLQGAAAGLFAGALLLILLPHWVMLVLALFVAGGVQTILSGAPPASPWLAALPAAVLIPSAMLQIITHWDKAIILRAGKFQRVQNAGLFLLIPFLDRIAAKVDTRIRVTDFSAERTLSRDNVPVHIDAICFWMIWDAGKAILELENYLEAITLSAQTALRDAIGTHDLSTLLSERDKVGRDLQQILDTKTDPWGITVLSVEFTDIIIPKELEDAMSKKAQADRERQARLILGETEIELAQNMCTAEQHYKDNPEAFQLRAMNMVYDALRQSKGSVVLIPSSAAEQMNLGSPLGTIALQKSLQNKTEGETP